MNRAISDKASAKNGINAAVLESQILKLVKHYQRLTVRMLYYILTSKFEYPATRSFYKKLDYRLCKMRRTNPKLNAKFIDPTRQFLGVPEGYRTIELWVEKDTIRTFLEKLAIKYRLSIQVLRGFASLSMFRKALARAASRGVKKILYIGDFDPSGNLIDKIASREMKLKVQRIALTRAQIRKYGLPSRPVNMRDSRADAYVAKYGPRAWEVEALRPRTFWRLVEAQLRMNVPHEFLVEADFREKASAIAKPAVDQFRASLEQQIVGWLKHGKSRREILLALASKTGLETTKRG